MGTVTGNRCNELFLHKRRAKRELEKQRNKRVRLLNGKAREITEVRTYGMHPAFVGQAYHPGVTHLTVRPYTILPTDCSAMSVEAEKSILPLHAHTWETFAIVSYETFCAGLFVRGTRLARSGPLSSVHFINAAKTMILPKKAEKASQS